VLVTNRVCEAEGWVAFDGQISISDFASEQWSALLDEVAPKYWDMSNPDYANEIQGWHAAPEAFVSLSLTPQRIRSGA